ncbi:hypothetical protein NQD34_014003 [Periophthalmus magnuspinnatus]|nr:hypothetical protein NQD34_014003 [Periophthalmus magnuspinnatus]
MSSEVCPFCGKSFKRLKSHLPHCKAAAGSTTSQHEEPKTKEKSKTTTDNSSLDMKAEKQEVKALITPKASKKRTPKWSEKIKMAAQMSSPTSVESSEPSSSSKSKTKINLQSQNDQESISNNFEKFANVEVLPESDFEKQPVKSSITSKRARK